RFRPAAAANRCSSSQRRSSDDRGASATLVIARSAGDEAIPFLVTMDCFAEPVIGRAFARTRWFAITGKPVDREFIIDLFSDFGPVTIRPMFSGFGIFVDGVNFPMALRAVLYYRADELTIPKFQAEQFKPLHYQPRA